MKINLDPEKTIYIIDGHSYIHRAYHALPPLMTSKGLPINAVFGFIRMVFKIMNKFNPKYLCIVLDAPGPSFRNELYFAYKSKRKKIDEELKFQIPVVYEFVNKSNIFNLMINGFEADDVIAALTKKFEDECYIFIISADKDILQLVNDNVFVYNEPKDIIYDKNEIERKYKIKYLYLIDYFSLTGDSSDNIPGVKGVGEKTAIKLINEYGDLDSIYENIQKIEGKTRELLISQKENAYKSKKLIQLVTTIEQINEIRKDQLSTDRININLINEFLIKYEMQSIVKELKKKKVKEDIDLFIGSVEHDKIIIENNEEIKKLLNGLKNKKLILSGLFLTKGVNNKKNILGFAGVIFNNNNIYKRIFIPIENSEMCNNQIKYIKREDLKIFIEQIIFSSKIKYVTYGLKDQLTLLLKNSLISNIKFNCNFHDIKIAHYLLNPSRNVNSLSQITEEYLSKPSVEVSFSEEFNFRVYPIDKLSDRVLSSLENLFYSYKKIYKQLKINKLMNVYKNIEIPLSKIIAKMEYEGILVDKDYLRKLKEEIDEKINNLADQIRNYAGYDININSTKQLSFLLFEKLKLPKIKKKKTVFSTDEEVLIRIKNTHPIIELLLEYRELEKLKNTYIDPMFYHIDINTKRIHTTFNTTQTSTGRLSSSNPNLQNVPVRTEYGRKFRKIFIADEKYQLVSFDYSQIELRILAHFSEDAKLIRAFENNEDIHSLTASEVFSIPLEKVDENLRRKAKAINFGIIYGISAVGLAKQLEISVEEAQQYIDKYFEKYIGVKKWIDRTITLAKKQMYVQTLMFRKRFIPEINSPNTTLKSYAERLAINSPIQGTASDIIKLTMIKINEYMESNSLDIKMLLQIHDELIFEINENILDYEVPKLKEIMENIVQLKVKLVVNYKISKRWE